MIIKGKVALTCSKNQCLYGKWLLMSFFILIPINYWWKCDSASFDQELGPNWSNFNLLHGKRTGTKLIFGGFFCQGQVHYCYRDHYRAEWPLFSYGGVLYATLWEVHVYNLVSAELELEVLHLNLHLHNLPTLSGLKGPWFRARMTTEKKVWSFAKFFFKKAQYA